MSTSAKTLIAAPVIYNELKDAEEKAIAVLGLLEDVIQPAFGDLRCDGLLDQKGKSRGDCAIDWVEKNFNALYSACYAARSLIEDVADTLQMLPVQQETEIRRAPPEGGESPPGAGEGGADRSTPPDQGRPTGHAGGATGGGEVAARAGIKR